MTTGTIPEYVTRNELEIRLSRVSETDEMRYERLDDKLASMEKMVDVKLSRMEALMEKSISENRAMISDMKAEVKEVRGDMKALDARLTAFETKFGWYLTLFGAGITMALGVLQLLIK